MIVKWKWNKKSWKDLVGYFKKDEEPKLYEQVNDNCEEYYIGDKYFLQLNHDVEESYFDNDEEVEEWSAYHATLEECRLFKRLQQLHKLMER